MPKRNKHVVSPISCPWNKPRKGKVKFQPSLFKIERGTLFYKHKTLMKWDWDLLGMRDEHGTIQTREEVLELLVNDKWASTQTWALVDTFGGVAGYCLSTEVSYTRDWLAESMSNCKVDPYYIQWAMSCDDLTWQHPEWCSRVWTKPDRPEETYTGRFRTVYSPEGSEIIKSLQDEFTLVLSMYAVFDT